jgi:hypothetical protein
MVIKPIFNGFSPFLGVIGQFWSLNSWRKLRRSQASREAFEEETLSDHFWELRTSVLRVVFFAWF